MIGGQGVEVGSRRMKLTGHVCTEIQNEAGTARNRKGTERNAGGVTQSVRPLWFIVRPHPQYADNAFLEKYLVDLPMLDI